MEIKNNQHQDDLENFLKEAGMFAESLTNMTLPELFGITDGKAVGALLECKLKLWMNDRFF